MAKIDPIPDHDTRDTWEKMRSRVNALIDAHNAMEPEKAHILPSENTLVRVFDESVGPCTMEGIYTWDHRKAKALVTVQTAVIDAVCKYLCTDELPGNAALRDHICDTLRADAQARLDEAGR